MRASPRHAYAGTTPMCDGSSWQKECACGWRSVYTTREDAQSQLDWHIRKTRILWPWLKVKACLS
jgi:hypothetical protein